MKENKFNDFLNRLESAIKSSELIKLVLSGKRDKSAELKNVMVPIVKLKKGNFLKFVYRYNTKDITKNFKFEEGRALKESELNENFYIANLHVKENDLLLQRSKSGSDMLKITPPSLEFTEIQSHDKVKERLIKNDNNIYLYELGIVNANWEIRREMYFKYKQINKYIEILAPYLTDDLLNKNCKIVDMGSGKGYLTFALYDYITNVLKKEITMVGVEMRSNLVESCNAIAKRCNFTQLSFVEGTIQETPLENVDVLIALHACDTATDESIYRGITANASLIVCAPCCHKQLRKEFHVSSAMKRITQYGILKERQAELLTDGIRAMLLEASGYKTNVMQFIETDHTPKNVMIVGEKTSTPNNREEILADLQQIKQMFGIKEQCLERLLSRG